MVWRRDASSHIWGLAVTVSSAEEEEEEDDDEEEDNREERGARPFDTKKKTLSLSLSLGTTTNEKTKSIIVNDKRTRIILQLPGDDVVAQVHVR